MESLGMKLVKQDTSSSSNDEISEKAKANNRDNEYEESEESKDSECEEDDSAQEIGRDKIGR